MGRRLDMGTLSKRLGKRTQQRGRWKRRIVNGLQRGLVGQSKRKEQDKRKHTSTTSGQTAVARKKWIQMNEKGRTKPENYSSANRDDITLVKQNI